jgi:hypothetical protein
MKAQRRGAQDPLAENAAWAKAIRNEVMARLLESGYLRSVEQPHFVVAFYLGLRERPAAGYLDYDLPTTLAHEPLVWHSGWPPATDVWELPYTDSTLILDIIDTNDNRLVWRGFDTATIDVRAADRTFPKAIDKLLTRFRQDSARPRTSTRER